MSEQVDRIVDPEFDAGDGADFTLRPQTLDDFIGQKTVRENLSVFIRAASERGEALDHTLLHGPPGLGRRRWRRLSLASWVSVFARLPGR